MLEILSRQTGQSNLVHDALHAVASSAAEESYKGSHETIWWHR